MATVDENMAIVRRVTELIEKEHNIDGLDEVFAKDFVNHSPSPGFTSDLEGFKQTAENVHRAFDLADSSVCMFGVDDMVVEQWTELGTHVGTYHGVPATGRRVVTKGIAIFRLRDGKIAELWVQVNEADILRQIGLLTDADNLAKPSGNGDRMERSSLETLPDLADEYPLKPEQIAEYKRDGHIVLRAVASSDEVAAYRTRIRDAVARYNYQTASLEERDESGKRAFIQVVNLWERDEDVRRFVFASRFAKIAADLMEVDRVRLLYDQALFKQSGGKPTDWHQDEVFFPALEPSKIVSMWMPLVPVQRSMTFMSGIHTKGNLQAPYGIDERTDEFFNQFLAETNARVRHYGAMAPGDVTFHDGWTPHRASALSSEEPTMREVMTIIFFADGAHVVDPRAAGLSEISDIEDEMATFGWQVGDPAEGPVAPVLYDRSSDARN